MQNKKTDFFQTNLNLNCLENESSIHIVLFLKDLLSVWQKRKAKIYINSCFTEKKIQADYVWLCTFHLFPKPYRICDPDLCSIKKSLKFCSLSFCLYFTEIKKSEFWMKIIMWNVFQILICVPKFFFMLPAIINILTL